MNKSIAVMNVPLPRDILNHVCSFIYYTEDQSIKKHKLNYTEIVYDLFYTIRLEEVRTNYYTVMIYNITSNFDIIIHICKCGDYRYKYHKRHCKCN